jgi:[protein-PII] uridylyltransferase
VRNRLHYLCQRKCDQLHFENQIKLAEILKFKRRNGQQPVERFLGELHGWTEYLKQQYLMFLYELGLEKKRRRKKKAHYTSKVEGLQIVEGGMLSFLGPVEILKVPQLLIQIFEESARLKIPLSAEAKRLVREFSHLIDRDFRSSRIVVKSFERILAAPVPIFNVLNEMLNAGFLGQFIPEFRHIINRIQYDEYHLYPVDKHTLHTVRTIKELAGTGARDPKPLYKQVYKELKNKKLLLWTALLHDIGKGHPGGNHSERGAAIVRTILQEKGVKPKDIETAEFLVKEHLFLIKAATRRDIHDEETAIVCARKIKDAERLKMLYLLTVADAMSTGPMAWNDWNAALLRDLFLKVLNVLEKGELATWEAMETIASKKADIILAAPTQSVRDMFQSLFDVMSPRYLLYTPAAAIVEHVNLYETLGDNAFVWKIERSMEADARTVTICAQDRPGLISKIAGVFTLNNIDILDVQVFTWRNNIALDIFKIKPPPDQLFEDEKWKRTQTKLKSALTGDLDLAVALKKKFSSLRRRKPSVSRKQHRIRVDNKSSSFFTIIEVFTYDFPGLLFSVTDALFNCKLDIWVAKIATKADQVVDVFYVRDLNGQKVDHKEQVNVIKETVFKQLPPVG